jgi:hypothetical protein
VADSCSTASQLHRSHWRAEGRGSQPHLKLLCLMLERDKIGGSLIADERFNASEC